MKFQRALMVTGLSAWGWTLAAAPELIGESAAKAPAKSVAEWVQDLSNDQFRVRENATRKIWEIGEEALPSLQEVANGKDPETAYRARELVKKIELHLTPDTDPEVMKLVERYAKASTDEKQGLLDQMGRKRAWRQILKLYASEKNSPLLRRIQSDIDRVAVTAARECLVNGDPDGAREYLEMAPSDPAGLLALADFHRSQGTLEAELKRAKTLKGESADAWLLALYRASGNIEAARDAATAAGETRISAAMSVLLGDPIPWMQKNLTSRDGVAVHKTYTELAIKRWQGKKLLATDLEPIVRLLGGNNRNGRMTAINSLFLLGEPGLAEEAFAKVSPREAFLYFESLERIPEAIKALGLDPENPDYVTWVDTRVSSLFKDAADEDGREMTATSELMLIANFMDRRGMSEEFQAAFMKPLAKLAEKDEKTFTDFLGLLFGNGLSISGAPDMAKRIAVEWAGENAGRWEDVIDAAFGEDDETAAVWGWLADLDPKATLRDRFDGLLALKSMGTDPLRLREKWLALGWKAIEQTPGDQRKPLFEKMYSAVGMNPDVVNNLKLWDLYPKEGRDNFFRSSSISELTIVGRWDEAATFFLNQIARIAKAKLDPSPYFHACASACLRKAGRMEEAAIQDEWVEKLALGNDAYKIAIGYQFGDDFTRAARWCERAVRQEDPSPVGDYFAALEDHGKRLLDQGKWREAAAVFEANAQTAASLGNNAVGLPVLKIQYRLQSDLGRALADLKTDRAGSLALLEHCYQMFPGDGTLADYFFPCIRRMGLIKEHDAWFKMSWDRMSAVVAKFPGSSNTLNTTGWLAARAMRNLDQAEDLLERALALQPDEPNYLDTMAEIQFGKGNREKALEWSTRAVNFKPGGDDEASEDSFLFRRQHEHFRADPLLK